MVGSGIGSSKSGSSFGMVDYSFRTGPPSSTINSSSPLILASYSIESSQSFPMDPPGNHIDFSAERSKAVKKKKALISGLLLLFALLALTSVAFLSFHGGEVASNANKSHVEHDASSNLKRRRLIRSITSDNLPGGRKLKEDAKEQRQRTRFTHEMSMPPQVPPPTVESVCPCSGVVHWKNHGEYVSCVAEAVRNPSLGIDKGDRKSYKKEAAMSDCGKKSQDGSEDSTTSHDDGSHDDTTHKGKKKGKK